MTMTPLDLLVALIGFGIAYCVVALIDNYRRHR